MINPVLAVRGQIGGVLAAGAGGAAALPWYDPSGAFADDGGNLYAWRAQNSVGTIWPGGPANYAATLTDQSSGQVLTPGNGYDGSLWAATTGWGFTAALAQWLNTALIPANDQSWSIFVQFNSVTNDGDLVGVRPSGTQDFRIRPNQPGDCAYANGERINVAPALLAGNLGIAGNRGYRNGAVEGAAIVGWTGLSSLAIAIGARRLSPLGTTGYITANIFAVWIYDQNPALVQAQAVLADGFRAAMGQL